jgi:nitrate/nitrite-specific signal transduction histidine kinase
MGDHTPSSKPRPLEKPLPSIFTIPTDQASRAHYVLDQYAEWSSCAAIDKLQTMNDPAPFCPAPATALPLGQRLGVKLNILLAVFFLFALTLILLSLRVAWQLEGGAAAINDAGSLRMRTYGLGFYLHQSLDERVAPGVADIHVHRLQQEFETTLSRLEAGDPERPLFLPREKRIGDRLTQLRTTWNDHIVPRLQALLAQPVRERHIELPVLDEEIKAFVPLIDELVLMIERSNAGRTNQLFMFQNILVLFSLLGTLLLAFLVHHLVTRPLDMIQKGIVRMGDADFAVRLPVVSHDEFGALTLGFNRMADRLQNLYATLEQRVEEKTRSAEEKSRELARRDQESAVIEERNLLAQELHDSIAQSLAFLNIQAQMLETALRADQREVASAELAKMREGIQESYDNVRELLVHFRIRVDSADLIAALQNALDKFEGQTGIRCIFERSTERSPTHTSIIQVLHIVQEALSNIRKHAHATQATLRLLDEADGLRIDICDNGRGFAQEKERRNEDGAHVGLKIMRERAHRIGARLDILSTPGQGSCIRLKFARPALP